MAIVPKSLSEAAQKGIFLICLATISWLGMQIVHEAGHILAAWGTGGTVVKVNLHPLHISETTVRPKPYPEVVIWAGPVFGSVIPLLIWGITRRFRSHWEPCFKFFAGFCLIANGAYLGSAVSTPIGDAFDLVQLGTPRWQLGLFGAITVPLGIWCWDGLTKKLGIGQGSETASWRKTVLIGGWLIAVTVLELLWSTIQESA